MTDRIANRAKRLLDAHAKMVAKVQADPSNPMAETWKSKALEYEASLASIRDHGRERSRLPVAGVEIKVPASGFAVSAKAPEA